MTYGYAITNAVKSYGAGIYNRISGVNTAVATAAYLKDGWMGKLAAIGTLANNDSIIVDFGTAAPIVGFALLNHNIITSGGGTPTVTVKGADDSAISTNPITLKAASTLSNDVDGCKEKDHILLFPAAFTHASVYPRYYQLLIAGMGGSTAITMGELFAITAVTSFSRGSLYGSSSDLDAINTAVQMQYGEPRSLFLGGPIREETYKFGDWTASQLAEYRRLYRNTAGFASAFLWCESVNSSSSGAVAADQACLFGNGMLDRLNGVQDDYGVWQPSALTIRNLGREAGA